MTTSGVVYPYIPNSVPEVQREMLDSIGAASVDDLFERIPGDIRLHRPLDLPPPLLSEAELHRCFTRILAKNATTNENISFLGGGCWNHYVPAICDEINQRSEFLTAYAGEPYEDHGRFQALFEYTSMMAELVDTDVVNVPTYDGAQAAATSIRMCSRIKGRNRVLVAANVHPETHAVIRNYCHPDLSPDVVPIDPKTGCVNCAALRRAVTDETAAVYVENPSFFGTIDTSIGLIAEIVHGGGALLVVGTDPSSLGLLTPPSRCGADITCGDIQPLGMHQYFGGGRGGFIATRDDPKFIREYPSRLFGIAPTAKGEWGFGDVAWERTSFADREHAKEYVGTAAALWGITAGVYLALMGPKGMRELGEGVFMRCRYLMDRMAAVPGVTLPFAATPHFKEFVVCFDGTGKTVDFINAALRDRGIFGGFRTEVTGGRECALYSVTEVLTQRDMDTCVAALRDIVA